MQGVCAACLKHGALDACHIKSKGAGGSNGSYNLIFMCRQHHQEQHRIGWQSFLDKYDTVRRELERKGWTMEVVLGRYKMWHDKGRGI